jgi:SPP1 gp7 family putative phage head morphogenesis protein
VTGKVEPLEVTFPLQPADNVTSYDQSFLWSKTTVNGERYNPDELVGQRGLVIYAKMLNDEQVKAVVDFKLSAILARGWQFKFDEESELSEEEQRSRVQVFAKTIKKMKGSFADALDSIASGREYGFSVTEKVYGKIKCSGKLYIAINKLLTRDPNTFKFFTDDYGNLLNIKQRVSSGIDVDIDQDRVIHYVHRPKWDTVYGRSDLRAAYRSWYAKDNLVKMWLLFLEKFAGGIAVAKRESDLAPASNTPDFTSLQNALQNLSSLRSIVLPKGVTLEILFPSSTDQYEKAIVYHDLAIAKALLVPNLLGLSHTGQTGAYSQSQTQFEAFMWTLNSDAQRIEETLNEQLFKDLGDQNWGDDDYPSFAFKPVSLEHAKWLMETWQKLLSAKAVLPTEEDERFLREMLEFPARDEESTPLVDPMAQQELDIKKKQAENPAPTVEKPPAANEDKYAAAMEQIAELRTQLMILLTREPAEREVPASPNITVHTHAAPATGTTTDESAGELNVHFHGAVFGYTNWQLERAARRVSFAVIDKRTQDVETYGVTDLATNIAKAVKKALGNDEQMQEYLDSDTADIAAFAFNPTDIGRLKSSCRNLLDRSWTLGQQHASAEIQSAKGEAGDTAKLSVKLASLRNKAAAYFDTQSFRMAGDASDQARKIIQQELQNGVKFGTAIKDVRANIWDRLVNKGLTKQQIARGIETDDAVNKALDALWLDTEEQVAAYLDTLVRTNTFEALNEARYAEFRDPDVADFVVGLQYASVMDESTTEICQELDDKIYATDSEVWDRYRPPNHFNCRSILIPITTLDDWNGQESEEPDVEPAEGFK